MVPNFSFLVFLHGLQRRVNLLALLGTAFFAALLIVYINNNKRAAASFLENEGNRSINRAAEPAQPAPADGTFRERKLATWSTIKTPDYEVSLFWAIPFIPRGKGEGLVRADSGQHFVLLDLSVHNTTTNRPVDVGEILLKAKIRSADGREYASDPLIIAAFHLEYPYPNHKEHYRSSKGVLHPGQTCRAIVLGFEVPVDTKNFVLLLEDDTHQPENKRYEAAFALK